jgi:hypothetical protein
MAEKRKNNATMNSKGVEASVSDEQVGAMIARQGQTSLLLVEVTHGAYSNELDGSHRLALVPGQIELVPQEQEDRVRRFMRALYLARPDQFGQEAFDGATPGEPKLADTASDLDAVVETNDEGEPTGVWTGDPDAPLPTGDGGTKGCSFPGCTKDDEHDGDHDVPAAAEGEDAAPADESTPAADDLAKARAKSTRKAASGS